MKFFRSHILFFSFVIYFGSNFCAQAQTDSLAIAKQEINQDNLGNVTDKFQEYFFQALSQRGIENYEKAISALKKCAEIHGALFSNIIYSITKLNVVDVRYPTP